MCDERTSLMTLFAARQAPRYARRSVYERLLAYRRSSLRLVRFASLSVVDNRFSVLPHLLVWFAEVRSGPELTSGYRTISSGSSEGEVTDGDCRKYAQKAGTSMLLRSQ